MKVRSVIRTTWLCLAAGLAVWQAALLVVITQAARRGLDQQRASTARILESLPDYYAPQRSATLKIKPLGIAIVPQPSSSSSP